MSMKSAARECWEKWGRDRYYVLLPMKRTTPGNLKEAGSLYNQPTQHHFAVVTLLQVHENICDSAVELAISLLSKVVSSKEWSNALLDLLEPASRMPYISSFVTRFMWVHWEQFSISISIQKTQILLIIFIIFLRPWRLKPFFYNIAFCFEGIIDINSMILDYDPHELLSPFVFLSHCIHSFILWYYYFNSYAR